MRHQRFQNLPQLILVSPEFRIRFEIVEDDCTFFNFGTLRKADLEAYVERAVETIIERVAGNAFFIRCDRQEANAGEVLDFYELPKIIE